MDIVHGQLHAANALPLGGGDPADYWTGGWVDLRNSLDVVENKNLSASTRNQYPVISTCYLVPGIWN
jgi:hypothetical protein